jgi:hypothetical protein
VIPNREEDSSSYQPSATTRPNSSESCDDGRADAAPLDFWERNPEQSALSTVDRKHIQTERPAPSREENHMQNIVLMQLRNDFLAAISSDQNDVTLDPAIAELRVKISGTGFLEPFSIYSRGQLRDMNGALGVISNVRLKDDPLQVAFAVDAIFKLFDKLAVTVKQAAASAKRIEAGRTG